MNIKIEYGFLYVSDEDREGLKQEFEKLQTIDEQYGFWQEKFGLNYSLNRKNNIQENTFEEFLIKPQSIDGIEELNRRIYNDWLELVPSFDRKSEIATWREKFEIDIKKATNKEYYIEYEISRIDDYVLTQSKPSELRGLFKHKTRIPPNREFVEGYEKYLHDMLDFDWGGDICSPYKIQNRLDGIECAKYKIYLKDYLKHNKAPKDESEKLSAVQKMLILDYMGLLDKKNLKHPDTKTSQLLSVVLERTPKKIKDTLTYKDGKGVERDKIRSVENLREILPFFEKLKMKNEVVQIKLDIDKLKEE